MVDIKIREEKIKEKRKQTSFRDFVKEICSWYSLGLYKYNNMITRYPENMRNQNIVKDSTVSMNNNLQRDYSGDFFQDFSDFFRNSKKSNILQFGINENCNFTDSCYGAKDCYLSFGLGRGVEKGCYSSFVASNCTNIFNSISVMFNCDNIYFSNNIKESSNVFYSVNVHNSSNIRFSSNLIGCHNCIQCSDAENLSYYIKNKKYTPKEYKIEKEKILKNKSDFMDKYYMCYDNISNIASDDVVGKGIIKSQNIENGYYVSNAINSRNVILYGGGKAGSQNFYDGIDIGLDSHDFYATCQAGTNASDVYCSVFVGMSTNLYYCMNMDTCSYCLGCLGLKNKSFCILNKEYSKEERYVRAEEIFRRMEEEGSLGQFFPGSMNPFYFNDTAAYLIDDTFTKEEVTKNGYLRRDEEIKVDIPDGAEVVEIKDLNDYQGFEDGNWEIDPEILKKVIIDEKGNYYRVIQMEYDFLMKYGLPLPELHWLDRIKGGFKFK